MAITSLPAAPSRSDPINFAARGDALLSALLAFVTEANALQVDVNMKQQAATAASLITQQAFTAGLASAASNAQIAISARDQALAGLGAADQSVNLVMLTAGIQGAMDLIAIALDFPVTERETDLLITAIAQALDLAGTAARQVSGGSVQLAAGTAQEPSLSAAGDRNTGATFPAADVIALVTGGMERLRIDASGYLGLGTNTPSGLLDVNDSKIRVRSAKTPASATAAGNAGEICWDANFVYVCTATNVWRRAALAAW